MNNTGYEKLLQKYHELKTEKLTGDKNLFKNEIILDSGTSIYPDYSASYFALVEEKRNILEQLLDIGYQAENTELKSIVDIVAVICSFSKWGLYFFCMEPLNCNLRELLLSKPLSYYESQEEVFKTTGTQFRAEEKLPFIFEWLKNSFRYKDEYELRRAVNDYCFYGEKYIQSS